MKCLVIEQQHTLDEKQVCVTQLEADNREFLTLATNEAEELNHQKEQLTKQVIELESMVGAQQKLYEDHVAWSLSLPELETAATLIERLHKTAVDLEQQLCCIAKSIVLSERKRTWDGRVGLPRYNQHNCVSDQATTQGALHTGPREVPDVYRSEKYQDNDETIKQVSQYIRITIFILNHSLFVFFPFF